jgi:hypothetical protein
METKGAAMKAWIVKDYKEIHMANCLIALAHTKPTDIDSCVELNILTDSELQSEVDKRVREEHIKGTFVVETLNKMQEDLRKEYQEREEINLKAIHELQDYLRQATQREHDTKILINTIYQDFEKQKEQIAREAFEAGRKIYSSDEGTSSYCYELDDFLKEIE